MLLGLMPRRTGRNKTPKAAAPSTPEEQPARYRAKSAASEIDRFLSERRDEKGKPLYLAKELADAGGMSESTFSHKMAGRRSKFTVNELGLIADHVKAPPAWPFYPWELCEVIDRCLKNAGR
jgi:hypothetical protein